MSKIYEALRRHEHVPALEAEPAPAPLHLPDNYLVANREMQTLFRSVESLTSEIQGGAILMFSSAHPGEGKTSVCGSFAATLAQHFGKSVLVLDVDRNHALTRQWGSQKDLSLSALAKSPESVLQTSKHLGERGSISAVPIGPLVGSASGDTPDLSLLRNVRERLARTFNYVLIDAPSVADVSWIPSIGAIADGVILVVEAERTRWPVVVQARQDFESSGAKVMGVFLNRRKFYIPSRIYRRL